MTITESNPTDAVRELTPLRLFDRSQENAALGVSGNFAPRITHVNPYASSQSPVAEDRPDVTEPRYPGDHEETPETETPQVTEPGDGRPSAPGAPEAPETIEELPEDTRPQEAPTDAEDSTTEPEPELASEPEAAPEPESAPEPEAAPEPTPETSSDEATEADSTNQE